MIMPKEKGYFIIKMEIEMKVILKEESQLVLIWNIIKMEILNKLNLNEFSINYSIAWIGFLNWNKGISISIFYLKMHSN